MFYSFSSSCPLTGTSVTTQVRTQISRIQALKHFNLFGCTHLKTTKPSIVNNLRYMHSIKYIDRYIHELRCYIAKTVELNMPFWLLNTACYYASVSDPPFCHPLSPGAGSMWDTCLCPCLSCLWWFCTSLWPPGVQVAEKTLQGHLHQWKAHWLVEWVLKPPPVVE